MAKNLVLSLILAHMAQIQAAIFFFFFQNSGSANSWSAIIMYNIRKNNDPILRKLSDRPRDRQADGQTDRWTRVISKDAVRLK